MPNKTAAYEPPPLVTVHFQGLLGDRFGKLHTIRGRSTYECIQGICANQPGLKEYLYHSTTGFQAIDVGRGSRAIDEEQLGQPIKELAIAPVVGGSGGTIGRIITGTVLLGVGIWTGGSTLILMGISMAGGAIVEALSPKQKTPGTDNSRSDSFLFNSNSGTAKDADPVPRAYGRVLCPAIVLNEAVDIADIPVEN